jgi:hypothetical protein
MNRRGFLGLLTKSAIALPIAASIDPASLLPKPKVAYSFPFFPAHPKQIAFFGGFSGRTVLTTRMSQYYDVQSGLLIPRLDVMFGYGVLKPGPNEFRGLSIHEVFVDESTD